MGQKLLKITWKLCRNAFRSFLATSIFLTHEPQIGPLGSWDHLGSINQSLSESNKIFFGFIIFEI